MVYHFLMTKSTNNSEFLKGRLYTTSSAGSVFYLVDEDDNQVSSEDIYKICDQITEKGGEFTMYKFDDKVDICVCCNKEGDGKVFKVGKLYICHMDKYDTTAEEPFANCFEGVEVKMADLKKEFVLETESPRLFFRNVLRAMDGEMSFSISKSEEFYQTMTHVEAEFQAKKFEKYKPTEEEYAKVRSAVINILKEYNHDWTDAGVDALLAEWIENKGEMISAFMSHPNYNGNFQLVFSNETYTSETSKKAGSDFINWVWDIFDRNTLLKEREIFGRTLNEWERKKNYLNATMPLVVPMLDGDKLELVNYDLFERKRREMERVAFTIQLFKGQRFTEESIKEKDDCGHILDKIYHYKSDRVDKEFADYVNERLPKVRAREGQKVTKVVGKIAKHYGIDLLSGYVKAFTDYCDAINVIKVTRHTILSLHPVDYLTMSFGNSWSSCHTVDKENKRNMPNGYEGLHASGTISYMLDTCSTVLYTVKSEYEGNTFFEMPKINRCMFHAMNERILQGRCYPQEEDDNDGLYTQFRILAQKVFSEIWGIPNMWRVNRSNFRHMVHTSGTHYPDYNHFSSPNMSIFKYSAIPNKDGLVQVGHRPICVVCGEEHTYTKRLNCCTRVCPECGRYIDEDEMEDAVRYNGRLYHYECTFYCEYHNRYEPLNVRYCYVENYGDICDIAWEEGDFYECDCCNNYFARDDMNEVHGNDYVCDICLAANCTWIERDEEYYYNHDIVYCNECGEEMYEGRANYHEESGHYYCNDCYDALTEEPTAEAV